MKFSIYRFNPEADPEPRMQDFELKEVRSGMMLLDALLMLKQHDETLKDTWMVRQRHACLRSST